MKKILYLFIMMIGSIASANDYILSSIEETLKLSQNSGKPALVVFGSEDCKFCDMLKNEILDKNYIDNYIITYICYNNVSYSTIYSDILFSIFKFCEILLVFLSKY
jgi:thioredoxin-related protein